MATTYTTNYHLGKQTNHADKFDMSVITDNADKIDAALKENADDISDDRAALVELVDGGAKNIAIPNHITGEPSSIAVVQDDKGHFEISGTTGNSTMTLNLLNQSPAIDLPYGAHISAASSISGVSYKARWYNPEGEEKYTTIDSTDLELPANSKLRSLYVQANANTQVSFAINQMVCSKPAWDISHTYQPYRPSYQELYDEVQAKITKSEVYNRGTAISTGDDLNDYTSFGKFYASTGAIATSLINCPITTGFVMTVEESFQAGKMQTLVTIESGGNATVTYRRSQVYRSNVWSWLPWYKFEGTAVT